MWLNVKHITEDAAAHPKKKKNCAGHEISYTGTFNFHFFYVDYKCPDYIELNLEKKKTDSIKEKK